MSELTEHQRKQAVAIQPQAVALWASLRALKLFGFAHRSLHGHIGYAAAIGFGRAFLQRSCGCGLTTSR